ncbi:hypothetical protein CLV84_1454 [Neolewinella xylanilytica]|uniref:Beta-galactosidase-like protein n=1 Tax=Neolewinella xylanilytica TaxID=1514080 RepID=A0A2S6IAH2_9BACT|nr:hypothetical protein [Neolewinella xylanilytica]PPK88486.1 hypothetical protein CLV84_1454 [Neolewinella xylanilytica]
MNLLCQRLLFITVLPFLSPIVWGQTAQSEPRPAVKYNPGHYVAVAPGFPLADISGLSEPALRGVNKRYLWRILEPEKDAYDLSAIAADLEYCSRNGKQLVVYLIDKAFWIKGAMPAYLQALEVQSAAGSFDPVRWHPEYVARFLALGKAIGERFGTHPNFEGVAIQETSLDMSEEDFLKYDYTPDKYRDALLEILRGLQQSVPQSRVFWYQNGLHRNDGHLRQIADSISGSRIAMGGPDILPHRTWLRNTYKIYGEYKDALLLFGSAQDDSYKHHKQDTRGGIDAPVHPEGYLSMEEIFLYARDSMYVNYLFWNQYYEGQPGERTFDDALEVIRKYPSLTDR